MVAVNFLWNPGTSNNGLAATAFSMLTTELNALTNTSYAVGSSTFSNTSSAQAIWAQIFATLGAIGSALTVGANLAGWFLPSYDGGTNFEQSSAVPPRAPDFIIPLPISTIASGAIYTSSGLVLLPTLKYKVGIQNNSGQTLAATLNVVRAAPVNMQSV
jgi:hypothetical protein